MKILFTGGGGAGNELVYRIWNQKYDLYFSDASLDNIDPTIPEERRIQIPFATDPQFSSLIASICQDYKIDLLVPSVDEELPLMAEVNRLLPDLDILVPEHQHVTLMMDKLKLMKYFSEHSIPAPYSTTLENIENLDFPFFVKPRWGRGSRGIQVIHSEMDLNQYISNSPYKKNDIIAQELMSGVEYTVMMSANINGVLRAVVPVKVNLKKGITIKAVTEKNKHVIDACVKIHELFKTRGCYNIQVFLQPDGTVFPIEINPRISTTFCLGVSSGVDPIEYFYASSINKSMDFNWSCGITLNRHWKNYIK